MLADLEQRPRHIIGPVAGEQQEPARPEQLVEVGEDRGVDETALMMARLWPRIGIEEIDAVKRGSRQVFDQVARIAVMDADIVELLRLAKREQLGDAIDERLGADEQDLRMKACPVSEMLAAAEAECEPCLA